MDNDAVYEMVKAWEKSQVVHQKYYPCYLYTESCEKSINYYNMCMGWAKISSLSYVY